MVAAEPAPQSTPRSPLPLPPLRKEEQPAVDDSVPIVAGSAARPSGDEDSLPARTMAEGERATASGNGRVPDVVHGSLDPAQVVQGRYHRKPPNDQAALKKKLLKKLNHPTATASAADGNSARGREGCSPGEPQGVVTAATPPRRAKLATRPPLAARVRSLSEPPRSPDLGANASPGRAREGLIRLAPLPFLSTNKENAPRRASHSAAERNRWRTTSDAALPKPNGLVSRRSHSTHGFSNIKSRIDNGRRPASGPPRTGFTVNVFCSKSSKVLLNLLLNDPDGGWLEEKNAPYRGSILWIVGSEDLEDRLNNHRENQRLSRIPGMHELCNKAPLTRLLRAMKMAHPEAYPFWPQSWVLPQDSVTAKAFKNEKALILKPDEGTQGAGIHIVLSKEELDRRLRLCDPEKTYVLQSYLHDPMLLNGYKFDMRLYVLVLSLSPLRLFVCREGLVRVCSEKYESPTARNQTRVTSHLTNYTLNKSAPNFEHYDDPTDGRRGTKRCMSAVLDEMDARGIADRAKLWGRLEQLIGRSVVAMALSLQGDVPEVPVSSAWPPATEMGKLGAKESKNCFHVLGFDVMLTADGAPHLLEVNCNPSMSVDSVYATEGPYAMIPTKPAPTSPHAQLVDNALKLLKGQGVKTCRCMAHHRTHLHFPCLVDLEAKRSALGGALEIVRRDVRAARENTQLPLTDLVQGTAYNVIDCTRLVPKGYELKPPSD